MTSTFHGLETAKRGMFTQQNALYVTGHNIANANTPGFSRQRVNFVQTEPYPAPAMNRPQIPGQMGTGVKAGSIERIRESFLDKQYQSEYNKVGYWESRADALSKMEDIMNEPSENGLSTVMGEFWQSLQDLSTYPENEGTRQVVLQRGQAVGETFHYLNDSLTSIKDDFKNEIGVNLKGINSILKQIGDLNRQIGEVEPHGYLPNDLYDQRDLLVDELSNYLNIEVTKTPSGGDPLKIAEGQYNIKLIGEDDNEVTDLVKGSTFVQLGFPGSDGKITYDDIPAAIDDITIFDADGKVNSGSIKFVDTNGEVIFSSGKLRGLIESYGYNVDNADGTTTTKGIYPDMLDNLDKLAYSFANIFNKVHSLGYDLKGALGSGEFFKLGANYKGAAEGIVLGNLKPSEIAASTPTTDANGNVVSYPGEGKNALNLANIANMLLSNTNLELEDLPVTPIAGLSEIDNGTINSFYEGIIGQLGVDAMQANRLVNNSTILSDSVNEKRQSVSSVSLDEEMTNLIKFQQAYNAAARQITIVDEMLDKIINGMGLGGR